MSRRRRTAAAAAVSLLLVVLGVIGVGPATATTQARAADAPQDKLALTIDSLSPTYLRKGKPVEMTGRITNLTEHAWTDLKVYLVLPSQPLTSREALDASLEDPSTMSTGQRIVEFEAIATAGDLGPGDTTTYRLRVPYHLLGVSASSGVYPIGAQVLATDDKGLRSNQAVGRTSTLIPSMPGKPAHKADSALIWPFTAHIQRRPDGTYAGTQGLLDDVSPGGRLRRLLDLARSGGSTAATVLVDPALLDALDDIANGTFGPPRGGDESPPSPFSAGTAPTPSPTPTDGADETDAQPAQDFLDDLVAFARQHPVWTLPYGQPDLRALTRKGSRKPGGAVGAAASAATTATMKRFGLTARQVFWPTGGITSGDTLKHARAHGDRAAIVSPSVVSEWDASAGSMQRVQAGDQSLPVVVNDPSLMDSGTQGESALEARQRIVSETALAALEGGTGSDPVVATVVNPSWDPGREWSQSDFYAAFDVPWATDVNADERIDSDLPSAAVELPPGVRPTPIRRAQVRAAATIVRKARVLASIVGDDPARTAYYNQSAGLAASQDWRTARTTGLAHARAQRDAIDDQLGKVTVQATRFVTLSGNSGRFPITITNHLDSRVTVGVRMRSDSPSLRIGDIEPTEIGPGQSRTVTVHADVGKVSNSAVTARLVAPDGKRFGSPARFSVRSSVVGVIIWIGMGVAGLLVVAAVARRLWRRTRHRAATGTSPTADATTASGPPSPADGPGGER